MKLSNNIIRKAIRTENLYLKCVFKKEIIFKDEYDLGSRVERIKISENRVEKEILKLEEHFKNLGKPACFSLDPSTEPENLEQTLLSRGYKENTEVTEVWWGLDLVNFKTEVKKNSKLKIELVESKEKALETLRGTDLEWWTKLFPNSIENPVEGIEVLNYIGCIDSTPVAVASMGIHEDISIFKGTEVIEKFQKQGIHTTLMLKRIQDAIKKGCKIGIYQTDLNNTASIATGKKFGFEELFRRRKYCKE